MRSLYLLNLTYRYRRYIPVSSPPYINNHEGRTSKRQGTRSHAQHLQAKIQSKLPNSAPLGEIGELLSHKYNCNKESAQHSSSNLAMATCRAGV